MKKLKDMSKKTLVEKIRCLTYQVGYLRELVDTLRKKNRQPKEAK